MLIDEGDFHASAFILGPDASTVLIRDKRKLNPLWKFPGGKKQLTRPFGKKARGETPLETLIREVHEETGIWLKTRLTEHINTLDMGHYRKHLFFSRINSFRGLVPLSKEYEEAKIFTLDELVWLPDFHPNYLEQYEQAIKPLLNFEVGR